MLLAGMGLPAPAQLPLFTTAALVDEAFLADLLERPVRSQSAELPGFTLARLGDGEARVLVPSAEHSAQGVLYEGIGAEDWRRLDAYQGVREGLYERTHVEVVVEGGRRLHAFIYLPSNKLLAKRGR